MTLHVDVLSPEKVVFQGEADEILAPTPNGQIAILPHHVSLLTTISQGEVVIKQGRKMYYIAVMGGFLQVQKDVVTVLADYAIQSQDIQLARAQEAKKRAEKLLEEKVSKEDYAKIEADLRRSLLELKVAQRRKKGVAILPQ